MRRHLMAKVQRFIPFGIVFLLVTGFTINVCGIWPTWLRPQLLPTSKHEVVTYSGLPKSAELGLQTALQHDPPAGPTPSRRPQHWHPIYKNLTQRPLATRPFSLVLENFPAAKLASSPAYLPPVPPWNAPPGQHVPESTPLFLGFTRNYPLLQQTVTSFIASGWPPSDIYVVDNSGSFNANALSKLSLQNPFHLNHTRLTSLFGVNVLTTPTLLSFAQLQNFYLSTALSHGWPAYFWSHMDIVVQSAEGGTLGPFKSFYARCVEELRARLKADAVLARKGKTPQWALTYFNYDWVTLMNTRALAHLGGWDPMIGYYITDCDMYERMHLANMSTASCDAGPVYDVGTTFPDLSILYRQGARRNDSSYYAIREDLERMMRLKGEGEGGRNGWQTRQMGGEGEMYWRDQDGFQEALDVQVEAGKEVYRRKWGVGGCVDFGPHRLRVGDEWTVLGYEEDGEEGGEGMID